MLLQAEHAMAELKDMVESPQGMLVSSRICSCTVNSAAHFCAQGLYWMQNLGHTVVPLANIFISHFDGQA